jgi:hypothetical protein
MSRGLWIPLAACGGWLVAMMQAATWAGFGHGWFFWGATIAVALWTGAAGGIVLAGLMRSARDSDDRAERLQSSTTREVA